MDKQVTIWMAVFLLTGCVLYAADAPSDVRVSPLLTTEWGQTTAGGYACFNYYTPDSTGYPPQTDGSTANYPSGCVATGMAQVMNFHQWAVPQFGWGATFTIYADGNPYSPSIKGGSLSGQYDWALMSDLSLLSARQEVGALLHDLGAALSMDYWSWSNGGSGTDFDYIDQVFCPGFTYSNAVTIEGNYVSGGTLMPQSINPVLAELAIMTNLDAGLPVLIGINDQSLQSGHVLVIDGYGFDGNGTAWFHYNFGMPVQGVTPPATNLGWFTLPGVGSTDDSAGYNVLDGVAFNIFPAVPVPATGEIISGRVTDKSGNPLDNIQVDITSVAPGFAPVTVYTNAQGVFAAYGTIVSNQQYTVTAHDINYASASQICNVGISAKQWISTSPPNDGYYNNTVGNVRLAFALADRIPIPTLPPIADLQEFAGLAQFWNTTHTQVTDPDIRYDYNADWRVDRGDLSRLIMAWLTTPVEFRTDFVVHFDVAGDLPDTMPWAFSGDGGAWSVVETPIHAAQSPDISDNEFTSLKLPVKMLPGQSGNIDIQFELSCDTEVGNVFEFLIDGVVQTELGGQSAFSGNRQQVLLMYPLQNIIDPQLMVLEWRYAKSMPNNTSQDTVWIGWLTVHAY